MIASILIMALWGCTGAGMHDSGHAHGPKLRCITDSVGSTVSINLRMPGKWDDVGVVVTQPVNDNDLIIGLNQQEKSMNYSATFHIANVACEDLAIDSYWLVKDNNYYLWP